MKKLTTIVTLIVTALALVTPSAFAATATSGPLSVSAAVTGTLSLTVVLKKNSSTGATLTALDYGTLQVFTNTSTGGQTLRSSTLGSTGTADAVAMITANSHGLPYTITQTASGALSNGTTTIPAGACTVVPVITTADNGGQANVGTVGTAGTWTAVTAKTLYTSDALGSMRTIQSHYSITDDPAAGSTAAVPINQAGGTYTGTVTITATA